MKQTDPLPPALVSPDAMKASTNFELEQRSIRTGCETADNRAADFELKRRGYTFKASEARWVPALVSEAPREDGTWSEAYISRLADQSQQISRMLSEAGVGSCTLVEGVREVINRQAVCRTHGDQLVCLACEADEDTRPEWRLDLESFKALARTHRLPRDPFAEQLSAGMFTLIAEVERLRAALSASRTPTTPSLIVRLMAGAAFEADDSKAAILREAAAALQDRENIERSYTSPPVGPSGQ